MKLEANQKYIGRESNNIFWSIRHDFAEKNLASGSKSDFLSRSTNKRPKKKEKKSDKKNNKNKNKNRNL